MPPSLKDVLLTQEEEGEGLHGNEDTIEGVSDTPVHDEDSKTERDSDHHDDHLDEGDSIESEATPMEEIDSETTHPYSEGNVNHFESTLESISHLSDSHTAESDSNTAESDSNAAESDSNTAESDSNTAESDSHTAESDSNTAESDSNAAESDSNTAESDSNTAESDSNTAESDFNTAESDSNTAEYDSGFVGENDLDVTGTETTTVDILKLSESETSIPIPSESENSALTPSEFENSALTPSESETSIPTPSESETSIPTPSESENSIPIPSESQTSIPISSESQTYIPTSSESENSIPIPSESQTSIPIPSESQTLVSIQPPSSSIITSQSLDTPPVHTPSRGVSSRSQTPLSHLSSLMKDRTPLVSDTPTITPMDTPVTRPSVVMDTPTLHHRQNKPRDPKWEEDVPVMRKYTPPLVGDDQQDGDGTSFVKRDKKYFIDLISDKLVSFLPSSFAEWALLYGPDAGLVAIVTTAVAMILPLCCTCISARSRVRCGL